MESGHNPIVVAPGVCRECHSVHSTQVHHRDYPEVWAEGETPVLAAARLVERLSLALDSAADRWRNDPIRNAIADARAFITRGGDPV